MEQKQSKPKLYFHGILVDVPHGMLHREVQNFAESLFGMTTVGSNEKRAAEWAATKAIQLIPVLREEARKIT